MTYEEMESFFSQIGLHTQRFSGEDNKTYIKIAGYEIPTGSLAGRVCDIAIELVNTVPYIPPAAIHTNPILVEMNMGSCLKTMPSTIGPEWQYWSRVVRDPSPRGMVTHIATIFSEV